MNHLSKTQKDNAESLLRRAISLIYRDKPAEALNNIAETLDIMRRHYGPEIQQQPHADAAVSSVIDLDKITEQMGLKPTINQLIPAQRGAVCPSLLPACFKSQAAIKEECPICGMYHNQRVALSPLSTLGLFMMERGTAIQLTGPSVSLSVDDVVIFHDQKYTPDSRELWRTSIVGRVVFTRQTPGGFSATIAVEP